MKYLLDTHYLLWSLFDPEKIDKNVLSILENEEDEKYISGINLWEISLKYSLGKLEINGLNPEQITDSIIEAGFKITDIDYKSYASYYKLPKKEDHKDPFDRMLIWYSIQNDFILITKDSKIEQYIPDGLKVVTGT
ncbi:type II toxin-antitoxin system VapC family toxin [Marispirochaeta sp.]|jgi:PIN domain nuclease of toxin-antitoxin system|uniref:type II toxin-antitoxin system VapC family toxin n=1 Tax=Marispirochaeta sp. TaxID=2038653 RepID=UPI0029C835AB|nr:type II toxin-antitoxin system VapC family toxin [Marispirochaeta sp.]